MLPKKHSLNTLNPEVAVIAEIPGPEEYPPLSLEVAKIFKTQEWNDEFEIEDIIFEMRRGHTFAAFDTRGNIIGASVMKPPLPGSETAGVSNLFVLRSYRCQGVGSKLMELMESTAIEEGATKITLTSTFEADGFYSRIGYKMDEYEDLYKQLGSHLE